MLLSPLVLLLLKLLSVLLSQLLIVNQDLLEHVGPYPSLELLLALPQLVLDLAIVVLLSVVVVTLLLTFICLLREYVLLKYFSCEEASGTLSHLLYARDILVRNLPWCKLAQIVLSFLLLLDGAWDEVTSSIEDSVWLLRGSVARFEETVSVEHTVEFRRKDLGRSRKGPTGC